MCFCELFHLSASDVIQIITAIILLFTLLAIKKSNEESTLLNRVQSAENTIIKQIEFHYNILREINVNYGERRQQTVYGRQSFDVLYSAFRDQYNSMAGYHVNDKIGEQKRIEDSFTFFHFAYPNQVGGYFQNLYFLLKYIDELPKKSEYKKEYYIGLLKAQLSKYEILLIAYYCLWKQDRPKGENFIEYASKYQLLSALDTKALIRSLSSVKHEDIFKSYGMVFDAPKEFNN
jgi:hypothetical protein